MLADEPLEKDFAIMKLPSFHQARLFFLARMRKMFVYVNLVTILIALPAFPARSTGHFSDAARWA